MMSATPPSSHIDQVFARAEAQLAAAARTVELLELLFQPVQKPKEIKHVEA